MAQIKRRGSAGIWRLGNPVVPVRGDQVSAQLLIDVLRPYLTMLGSVIARPVMAVPARQDHWQTVAAAIPHQHVLQFALFRRSTIAWHTGSDWPSSVLSLQSLDSRRIQNYLCRGHWQRRTARFRIVPVATPMSAKASWVGYIHWPMRRTPRKTMTPALPVTRLVTVQCVHTD